MSFNVGDKVRLVDNSYKFKGPGVVPEMRKYFGKTVTLFSEFNDFPGCWWITEDKGDYLWHESWFEPVNCPKENKMLIAFSACTKEEAEKMAKEEIEKVFGPKSWTEKEIADAKEITVSLMDKVARNGGEVTFSKYNKCIHCSVYSYSFSTESKDGSADLSDKDAPNDWIGKCVAICKAMHEPVLKFIYDKNR